MPDILGKLKSALLNGKVADASDIAVDGSAFARNLATSLDSVQALAVAVDGLALTATAPDGTGSGALSVRLVPAASDGTFPVLDIENLFIVKLTATLGSGGNARTIVYPVPLIRADMSPTSQFYGVDSNNPGATNFDATNNIGFSAKIENNAVTISRTGYRSAGGLVEFYAISAQTHNVDIEAREAAARALASHGDALQVGHLDWVQPGQQFWFPSTATNIPGMQVTEGYGFVTETSPAYQIVYLPAVNQRWERVLTPGWADWQAARDANLPDATAIGTTAITNAQRVRSTTTGRPTQITNGIVLTINGFHVVVRGSSYFWRALAATTWSRSGHGAHPPPEILGTGVSELRPGIRFLIPASSPNDLPPGTTTGNAIFAGGDTATNSGGRRRQWILYYDAVDDPQIRQRNDTYSRSTWEQTEWDVLPVGQGGTGAIEPYAARINLGITTEATGDIPSTDNLDHAFADRLQRYPANATGRPSNEDGVVVTTADRQVAIADRDGTVWHRGKREVLAAWGVDVNQAKTAISDFSTIADQAVAYFDSSTTNVPLIGFATGLVARNGDYRIAVNGINWAWSPNATDWHIGSARTQPGPHVRASALDRLTGQTVLVRASDITSSLPTGLGDNMLIVSSPSADTRQRLEYFDPAGNGVWRRRERGKTKTWALWMRARPSDGDVGGIWGPPYLERSRRVTETGTVGSDQYRRRANDRLDLGFPATDTPERTAILNWSNEEVTLNGLPYRASGSALSGSRALLVVAPDLPDADTLGTTLTIRRRGTVISKEGADSLYQPRGAMGQSPGVSRPAPGIVQLSLIIRSAAKPEDPSVTISANGDVTIAASPAYGFTIPNGSDPIWNAYATATRGADGTWSFSDWQVITQSSARIEYYGANSLAGPFQWWRSRPTIALEARVLQDTGAWLTFDLSGRAPLATVTLPNTAGGTASNTLGLIPGSHTHIDFTTLHALIFEITTDMESDVQVCRIPASLVVGVVPSSPTTRTNGRTFWMTWSRNGNCHISGSNSATPRYNSVDEGGCFVNFVGTATNTSHITAVHVFGHQGHNATSAHRLAIMAEY